MRRYIVILLCAAISMLFFHEVNAQKHDYNYINRSTPHGSGAIIRYNEFIQDITLDTFQWVGTVSGAQVISDKVGSFLGYYNCRNLYDSIGRVAINGDSMGVGFFQNYLFSILPEHEGLGNRTNTAFIPITDSLFYLFYMSSELWSGAKDFKVEYFENGYKTSSYSDGLYLSKVRLRKDNRLYINEDEKHIIISKALFQYNSLMPCKHANGKDWWLLIPHATDEDAEVYLVHESGKIDSLASIEFSNNYWRIRSDSEFAFSSDGQLLARLIVRPVEGFKHILELFEFDRCEGKLTSFFSDSIPLASIYTSSSDIAFSENSRFLYIAIGSHILQFDIQQDALVEQADTVGIWDGYLYHDFLQPIFDCFWTLPDNRLLISSGVSTPFLHVINEPNLKGDSCFFIQRAYMLQLDALNLPFRVDIERLPKYPAYRMPSLDCSTLVTPDPNIKDLIIYPTLTHGKVYTNTSVSNIVLVTNLLGRPTALSVTNSNEIDLSSFPPGFYYLTFKENHSLKTSTKCVIKI